MIGPICTVVRRQLMETTKLLDELVVVAGVSADETTCLAAEVAGAHVVHVDDVMPEVPSSPGRGDAIWRSLAVLSGDIVVWIDADIRNFGPHFVTRLVAPLLTDPSIQFVKGFYDRPIELDGVLHPTGGGRVTELLARPLLNLFFPELGGFRQPLAGEFAARASVMRRVPLFTGYSVDAGILIDLLDIIGLDAMAQSDLGRLVHRNRSLEELGPTAHAIARTILLRAQERKRVKVAPSVPLHPLLMTDGDGNAAPTRTDEIERPPIDYISTYLDALRSSVTEVDALR
jgi:glucosyl-3-phosphoglycerate synthase